MRAGPEPILPAADVRHARSFYESLGFIAGFNDDHYEILRRGDLARVAAPGTGTSWFRSSSSAGLTQSR